MSNASSTPLSARDRWLALLTPLIGVVVGLALWALATTYLVPAGSVLSRFAPAPAFQALGHLVSSGEVWPHLVASLRRIVVGITIAIAVGVPLGLAVGTLRSVARLTGTSFQFLRMISPLAWTPLAIMLFGVGDAPVYFLVAMGAVWPILLNVAAGVHALNPRWLLLGRSLGATRLELFRTILWPGIRAHLLTGFRLAVGIAWVILVPAEMLGVDSGLGYAVLNTRDRLAYAELMAMILVIGACGFVMDLAVRWLVSEPWARRATTRRHARAAHTPASGFSLPRPTTSSEAQAA